jgi:hypothetical protein
VAGKPSTLNSFKNAINGKSGSTIDTVDNYLSKYYMPLIKNMFYDIPKNSYKGYCLIIEVYLN